MYVQGHTMLWITLDSRGGTNPTTVNATNAIIFGITAVNSLFIGAIVNLINPRLGLLVGF